MRRLAIVGAGNMALRRTKALLSTGGVILCGVASKNLDSATRFAKDLGIPYACDNFRKLSLVDPEVVLIQVPHNIQDQVVIWALTNGIHVLLGSFLATTIETAEKITALSRKNNLVIECGFEARYKECWLDVKKRIEDGEIGDPSFVNAIALWAPPKESWYLSQAESCGMPLTHMSYAFLNPLRWLFGDIVNAHAESNSIGDSGDIAEESCVVCLKFTSRVIANITCSYLCIPNVQRWHLEIFGTAGMIELHPGEFDPGMIRVTKNNGQQQQHYYADASDAFERQAKIFLDAIETKYSKHCLNTPDDAISDIRIIFSIINEKKTNILSS